MSCPKFRDRKFCAVLYPEDETHAACIEKLQSGGYNFAAILHDKDTYEDGDHAGELKKPHWHIVLKFVNARYSDALAKELGISANYFEQPRSLDGALIYLVHMGYENKYQYDLQEVFGPLKTRVASLLADTDESTRALTIFDLIRNSPGVVTYTEIFEKACKSGLYGDFRRMGTGVMYLINDHNAEYTRQEQNSTGVTISRDAFNDYLRWTGSKTDDIIPF